MGIEHGGEKAEGESTNTKREVKAPGITEWLEPLERQGRSGRSTGFGTRGTAEQGDSPLYSLERVDGPEGGVEFSVWGPGASGSLAHREGRPSPG